MIQKKYTLGDIGPLKVYSGEPQGSWIELNIGNHMGAGMLVWRMSGQERSPAQEDAVKELIMRGNAYDDLLAASKAVLSSFAYKPGTGPAWYEAARLAVEKAGAK